MPEDQIPNPSVPPIAAKSFVAFARTLGVSLAFTEESLETAFQTMLDQGLVTEDQSVLVPDMGVSVVSLSLASAYVGETLRMTHGGEWSGHFSPSALVNFYRSHVIFGDFQLTPICWLSYRITNGPEEGTVKEWISRIKPSIQARADLTPSTGFIKDIY